MNSTEYGESWEIAAIRNMTAKKREETALIFLYFPTLAAP